MTKTFLDETGELGLQQIVDLEHRDVGHSRVMLDAFALGLLVGGGSIQPVLGDAPRAVR